MPEIKFLSHKDIDKQRWDACVAADTHAPVYGFSWYLDAICEGKWDALVLGDYKVVFPLPRKRKFGLNLVYQPFFCQQLGLFGKEAEKASLDDFLSRIPKKFVKVHLQLQWRGVFSKNLKSRVNFVLNLNKPYSELYEKFSADGKKNLRKCENAGLNYTQHTDFNSVIALYRKVWGPLNPHVKDKHYQNFANACKNALEHNQLICVKAHVADEYLGDAIFLRSGYYLHYVCAAPTEAGRKVGVMHGIINEMVKVFANQPMALDFEGSENPAVAQFYLKFSPQQCNYLLFGRSIV